MNQQETPNLDPWHAFQRLLKTGERRVSVPFVKTLADLIPARAVRLRRDFGQLLLAIKAHAFIHRAHRERNDRGEIVASLEDYEQVRALMGELLSVASEVKLSRQARETIEAIDAIAEEQGLQRDYTDDNDSKGVTIKEVAARLALDDSAVRRRIHAAENLGLVVNVCKRPGPGRRGLYRSVYDPSIEDTSGSLLPTVEEIVERERGWDHIEPRAT